MGYTLGVGLQLEITADTNAFLGRGLDFGGSGLIYNGGIVASDDTQPIGGYLGLGRGFGAELHMNKTKTENITEMSLPDVLDVFRGSISSGFDPTP